MCGRLSIDKNHVRWEADLPGKGTNALRSVTDTPTPKLVGDKRTEPVLDYVEILVNCTDSFYSMAPSHHGLTTKMHTTPRKEEQGSHTK